VDEKLAAMTVEDLLTMRTGHAGETSGAIWRGINASWIEEFFKIPVVHPPGAVYVYTSAASYMLSAIITRTTGETLHDYLKSRLLQPLGITGEHWDIGPDGINPGGNGLTCKTADILKFGVLHAQKGLWNGQRLLPESWVGFRPVPLATANMAITGWPNGRRLSRTGRVRADGDGLSPSWDDVGHHGGHSGRQQAHPSPAAQIFPQGFPRRAV